MPCARQSGRYRTIVFLEGADARGFRNFWCSLGVLPSNFTFSRLSTVSHSSHRFRL